MNLNDEIQRAIASATTLDDATEYCAAFFLDPDEFDNIDTAAEYDEMLQTMLTPYILTIRPELA